MGYVDVRGVSHSLADGHPLLDDVSFPVGEGATSAPIGAASSTLLGVIRGDLRADAGGSAPMED